jgi:hypothetical protein
MWSASGHAIAFRAADGDMSHEIYHGGADAPPPNAGPSRERRIVDDPGFGRAATRYRRLGAIADGTIKWSSDRVDRIAIRIRCRRSDRTAVQRLLRRGNDRASHDRSSWMDKARSPGTQPRNVNSTGVGHHLLDRSRGAPSYRGSGSARAHVPPTMP